jgi:hypothetical protein
MDINLFEDLLNNLEVQIKQTESEIQKEKESTLFGIESMMEGAVDKAELASLDKQYEKAEKQFDQEIIFQKRKTIRTFVSELNRLIKHVEKVYSKELKNKYPCKENSK